MVPHDRAVAAVAGGLKLIDEEIAEMTAKLAQGDLDSLATRGRYLEIKYRDDGERLSTSTPRRRGLGETDTVTPPRLD